MTKIDTGGRGRIGEYDVARIGYGAMQLEPDSISTDDAVTLLRRAVELGVNHLDTVSFYSDGEVNRRIGAALAPYRDDLVIVSKVGAKSVTGGRIPLPQHRSRTNCAPPWRPTSHNSGWTASTSSTCDGSTWDRGCRPRAIRSSTSTTN